MQSSIDEREAILAALHRWIRQRPGLEFGNYGEVSAYRAELRSITKDLHQARALLSAVSWRTSIDAAALKYALKNAYSGRLSWNGKELSYCTGQYWPTEYRRAVCAVLASALWSYFRDNMPKGELVHNSETGETFERHKGLRAGDYLRQTAKRELGAAIAQRWFN